MNINAMRVYLSTKCGNKIIIIYNGSRNHKEKYSGILWNVYNNVFTIKMGNGDIKCFNYRDILTKTIHLYI